VGDSSWVLIERRSGGLGWLKRIKRFFGASVLGAGVCSVGRCSCETITVTGIVRMKRIDTDSFLPPRIPRGWGLGSSWFLVGEFGRGFGVLGFYRFNVLARWGIRAGF
jgi:hypothetical protein